MGGWRNTQILRKFQKRIKKLELEVEQLEKKKEKEDNIVKVPDIQDRIGGLK